MNPKHILLIFFSLIVACCKPKEPAPNPIPKPCEGTKVDFTADFDLMEITGERAIQFDTSSYFTDTVVRNTGIKIIPRFKSENHYYTSSFSLSDPYEPQTLFGYNKFAQLEKRFDYSENSVNVTITITDKNDPCKTKSVTKTVIIKNFAESPHFKGKYLCTINGIATNTKEIFIDTLFDNVDLIAYRGLRILNIADGYSVSIQGLINYCYRTYYNELDENTVNDGSLFTCTGVNCKPIQNSNLVSLKINKIKIHKNNILIHVREFNNQIFTYTTLTGIRQ